jgi:hypothetical protein
MGLVGWLVTVVDKLIGLLFLGIDGRIILEWMLGK